ncbi:biotin/lipoyl-binding protein [Roseateles sp.]|uniref:biotin/lipoyl-binding protein n=1 Tax=Roseateles sp. TaxID=1971397 RepID=UPI003D104DC4
MSDSPSPAAVPPNPSSGEAADLSELLAEPAARVWYRRPLFWGTGLLLALLALGLWWWLASRAAQAEPVYVTQLAARGDLSLTVSSNGSLQPTRAINIGSELSGTVLRVLVDVNDSVKKGQVLVELDTAKLRGQIQRSQAALQAAAARLDQVAATQDQATATLARLEEVARLSGGKVPAKTELDAARASGSMWTKPMSARCSSGRRPASPSAPTRRASSRPSSPGSASAPPSPTTWSPT